MRIHYRETESGIEIVRCFGTDGKAELPAVISGIPVTRAAAYAFSARKAQEDEDVLVCETEDGRLFRQQEHLLAGEAVESVIFPDTMKEIGKYIFYGCRNLRELTFSDSLTEIGSGAFTFSEPPSMWRVTMISSLVHSFILFTYVTWFKPSFSATCGPTCAVSPSMAWRPPIIRSHLPSLRIAIERA